MFLLRMTRSRIRVGARGLLPLFLALLMSPLAVSDLSAQYSFNPFYGKNRVKYDKFDWHIYTTDHFEIYYYPEMEQHLERVASYAESAYQALDGADVLVICTEWPEFRRPNLKKIKARLKQPLIFDGRNLYNVKRMAEAGFEYYSIGRPHHAPHVEPEVTSNGRA